MKNLRKHILIGVLVLGTSFVPALWLSRRYGFGLLGFYGLMFALIMLGEGLVWAINRVDAHLKRVYGPPARSQEPPRQHTHFDDPV